MFANARLMSDTLDVLNDAGSCSVARADAPSNIDFIVAAFDISKYSSPFRLVSFVMSANHQAVPAGAVCALNVTDAIWARAAFHFTSAFDAGAVSSKPVYTSATVFLPEPVSYVPPLTGASNRRSKYSPPSVVCTA